MFEVVFVTRKFDYPLFKLSYASFKKNLKNHYGFTIIVPDGDVKFFKELKLGSDTKIIPENSLSPIIRKIKIGWFRQQMIKLCLHKTLKHQFALVCDSDVFCTKPVSANFFMEKGKTKFYWDSLKGTVHPEWHKWAANLLKVKAKSNYSFFPTPNFMSMDVLKDLERYLSKVYGGIDHLSAFCGKNPKFTEWALYGTFFTEILKLENAPHVLVSNRADIKGIWNLRQLKREERRNFDDIDKPLMVFQSQIEIPYSRFLEGFGESKRFSYLTRLPGPTRSYIIKPEARCTWISEGKGSLDTSTHVIQIPKRLPLFTENLLFQGEGKQGCFGFSLDHFIDYVSGKDLLGAGILVVKKSDVDLA